MPLRDWTDPAAYTHMQAFSGAEWAWEFLRRNPRYRAEWQAFITTWEALEAQYGRPPNRDFCAWKNDPRAWVSVDDCNADCRIDQDKVLIECAFGARWGFHKFPPDPSDDSAVGEARLSWRERPAVRLAVEPGAVFDATTQALLRFDLDLPLKDQLERAKRELQAMQHRRVREQGMGMRSIQAMAEELIVQVRVLDALFAGVPRQAVEREFGRATVQRAMALRDGGYLDLPELPDR